MAVNECGALESPIEEKSQIPEDSLFVRTGILDNIPQYRKQVEAYLLREGVLIQEADITGLSADQDDADKHDADQDDAGQDDANLEEVKAKLTTLMTKQRAVLDELEKKVAEGAMMAFSNSIPVQKQIDDFCQILNVMMDKYGTYIANPRATGNLGMEPFYNALQSAVQELRFRGIDIILSTLNSRFGKPQDQLRDKYHQNIQALVDQPAERFYGIH